jgi:hypothetical protein
MKRTRQLTKAFELVENTMLSIVSDLLKKARDELEEEDELPRARWRTKTFSYYPGVMKPAGTMLTSTWTGSRVDTFDRTRRGTGQTGNTRIRRTRTRQNEGKREK